MKSDSDLVMDYPITVTYRSAPPVQDLEAPIPDQTAALHEFCRNPLHPGPCEGWKGVKTVEAGVPAQPSASKPAKKAIRKAKPAPANKPVSLPSWLDDDTDLTPGLADATPAPVAASGPMATADQLKAGLKAGIKERQDLSGGLQSHTERITFNDGTKGVHKKAGAVKEIAGGKIRTGQDQTDADELAVLAAKALGVNVPDMVRVPRKKDTAVYSLVDGKSGVEMVFDPSPGWEGLNISDTVGNSDDGIRLGLLDMIIENQDRHEGNWMIDRNDKLVAIDHGHSFEPSRFGAMEFSSPFTAHFADRSGKWKKKNPISKQDIVTATARLEALKPEFVRLGRADWHDRMMERLADVGKSAKGTKNLLDAA